MRIGIVNDMKMTTEMLRRIISASPHQIAWLAYDGAEAVEKCAQDRPDLILMDLIMPVMDGVQATRKIMQNTPCAILIVTATVSGNAPKVFEAMGCGALDVVKTPIMSPHNHAVDSKELLAKIDRIGMLIGNSPKLAERKAMSEKLSPLQKHPPLLLIGASTGGPKALVEVLSHLPSYATFATVIIQHVDEEFSAGLADWLSRESGISVKIAKEGGKPEAGCALLAGKNDHLIMVKGGSLRYTEEPVDNPYRPSVDVFFTSVAACWPKAGTEMAVLLTGMGSDGAKGMKALRDAGWHTLAQDEETSVVFGMPKAAIAMGGACEVLPISEMAPAIEGFFGGPKKPL